MEYLNDIEDKLTSISEENIIYTDVFKTNDLVYGAPYFNVTGTFRKFTYTVDEENEKILNESCRRTYNNLMYNTSGCFLMFQTDSPHIIIKAELRRKWDILRASLYNSSGFDMYRVKNGAFTHFTVFAPQSGKNIFAEYKNNDPQSCVCIYLPLYNEVKKLYIGAESPIRPVNIIQRPPIIFYGNSITQGAAASRSGNSFCNIVSRKMQTEIYNLSVSSCCKGQLSVADQINSMNARAIVIDYSRNALSSSELERNYLNFYKRIREGHKNTLVILMTSVCFNKTTNFESYDKVIYDTFEYARSCGHNTYILNQTELFEESEWDLASLDGSHYTDHGMYRVADEIIRIIKDAE